MCCVLQSKREAVEKHEKEALSEHLELITKHVAELQLKSLDAQTQLRVSSNPRAHGIGFNVVYHKSLDFHEKVRLCCCNGPC